MSEKQKEDEKIIEEIIDFWSKLVLALADFELLKKEIKK